MKTTSPVSRRHVLKAGAGLAGSLLAAAYTRPAYAAREQLVVRQERNLTVLDPPNRRGWTEVEVMECLYRRLVRFKPGGSLDIENDAAAEIRQASPTLIEFTLKRGLAFTDGFGDLTAEDVKFSFERFTAPGKDGKVAAFGGDWVALDHVEVLGTYQGRIVLKQPAADLWLNTLPGGSGLILSKKAYEARGDELFRNPVSNGPYKLVEWAPNRQVVLRINPGYVGPKPYFPEIVVRIVPDVVAAQLALRSGEVHLSDVATDAVAQMKKLPDLTVVTFPSLNYCFLGINMEKAPFTDIRVRQAIRIGVDVDQMIEAGYFGLAERARAMLAPGLLGYWKDAPLYKRDVAAARKLLAEAGFPSGFKTKLTILNQTHYKAMAQVAQANLAEIGVDVTIDSNEGATYWDSGKGDNLRNLELFLARNRGNVEPSFATQWFVTRQIGLWNWNSFRDPEYDRLDQVARTTINEAERTRLLIEAQKRMDQSVSFVFLTHEIESKGWRSWVKPSYTKQAYMELASFREG